MIKSKELEEKPLYSSWDYKKIPQNVNDLFGEPINMFCHTCENNQTFNCQQIVFNDINITNNLGRSISYAMGHSFNGGVLTLNYTCTHCHNFKRNFIIKMQEDGKMEKIGQYPPLDIIIPKEIKSLNKKDVEEIYQRGKISENLGYGIGAFAYYRRVVELCISKL
ncbi:MAG: hypothetical protein OQK82_02890, partial [Candidatus Pacearchaeota archaeon]|nr:hypothetical protein [Candidatus Pacearchaeota archaeon]